MMSLSLIITLILKCFTDESILCGTIKMMKEIFTTKSDKMIVQLVRYGFVAGVAFVIDFGLLYVFTQYLGIFYLLSATLSFFISLVANYFLSILWVFPNDPSQRKKQIILFIIIGFSGLLLNLLIIWILSDLLGVFYLISKLIAIVIVFFWSFAARRYMFKAKQLES